MHLNQFDSWVRSKIHYNFALFDNNQPNTTLSTRFTDQLKSIPHPLVLYTEGAKNSAASSQHKYRLPVESSTLTAELFAIVMALRWKSLFIHASPNFVICTDSSAALHKIQQIYSTCPLVRQIQDQLSILSASGKRMHFFRVPSHQGLIGNETADIAAKGTITNPSSPMVAQTPPSDAKDTIKEVLLLQWQNS